MFCLHCTSGHTQPFKYTSSPFPFFPFVASQRCGKKHWVQIAKHHSIPRLMLQPLFNIGSLSVVLIKYLGTNCWAFLNELTSAGMRNVTGVTLWQLAPGSFIYSLKIKCFLYFCVISSSCLACLHRKILSFHCDQWTLNSSASERVCLMCGCGRNTAL